jgi:hypothetical protein
MEHKDKRLERIRLYQGSIKDLVDFIKDKENETNQPPESKIDIEKQ